MANLQLDLNAIADLNDEEFLLLYHVDGPRNRHLRLPYWKFDLFNLEEMDDDECLVELRFGRDIWSSCYFSSRRRYTML